MKFIDKSMTYILELSSADAYSESACQYPVNGRQINNNIAPNLCIGMQFNVQLSNDEYS